MLYINLPHKAEAQVFDKDKVFKVLLDPVLKQTNMYIYKDDYKKYLTALEILLSKIPVACRKQEIDTLDSISLHYHLIIILKILCNKYKMIGQIALNEFQTYHQIKYSSMGIKVQDELYLAYKPLA